ncbi:MAG: hypothetical protein BWX61_01439 [Bacteroidetes bacterium ADurb.Bin035]|nr:MAG: hypothetical protein BWX61_01439 [Bacteroidetes bacterium ADurb.Bin035]
MRVKFKYKIQSYSGTLDNIVFGSYRSGEICIARKYFYPEHTEQNTSFGLISKNIAKLWKAGSEDFKTQLKIYSRWYKVYNSSNNSSSPGAYSLWIKISYEWAKDEHINLKNITPEEFLSLGTAIKTIKNCVDNGYLMAIPHYEILTAPF